MERKELLDQYDRFIEQIRTEAKDLYWLYNFFFIIESAMLGGVFSGKVSALYLNIAQISGFFLSIYWLIIIRKQRLWRNDWVARVQIIEKELGYAHEFQMWHPKRQPKLWDDYILGKKGMWRFLFVLPICFAMVWVVLYLFY